MSRIESSCTESNTSGLYTRQPPSDRTTPQSRQIRKESGQPEIAPTSVTLSTLPRPQKRAWSGSTSNVYSATQKTETLPATTNSEVLARSSESALMVKISRTEARIGQLLQRQPDFQLVISSAFRVTLNAAFPDVRQALDPDHIYVTEYVNATVVMSDDNRISERRPASSMTLSQTLQNALNTGHIPVYDAAQTGFFHAAGNAVNNPDEVVHGMNTVSHVTAFETILRSAVENSASTYQNAVNTYWEQPDMLNPSHGSPAARLISTYCEQRQIEATLRTNDATLSATGKQLLDQIYVTDQTRVTGNPPGVFGLALEENGTPSHVSLAGVFLVTRSNADRPDTTPGPVLLVAPGQGLMEFAAAQEYRDFMLTSLSNQRTQLLAYVDDEQHERAERISNLIVQHGTGQTASLRYDAIRQPVVAGSVRSRLERQQRDIAFAIKDSRQKHVAPDAALRHTLDLRPVFDITNINDTHQLLLLKKFLNTASTEDIGKWRTELQQYQTALKQTQTSGLPSIRQYLDPEFLNTYACDKVRKQVQRDLGFDIDPDQVIITTQTYFEHKPPIPNPTTIQKTPFSRTLTALSLANASQLGDASWNELTVKDNDGYPVPGMTHDYLSRMLRTVDIGRHYQELLQAHLLDSAEGKARETQYVQFLTAQLRLDSREAKMRGDITGDSMRWVLAALNQSPVMLNGQALQVRQLGMGGNTLSNILLFGTPPPILAKHAPQYQPISQAYDNQNIPAATPFRDTGISKVLLYTPDAPGGKRLREFASREEMKRTFIQNPLMHDYLLQHAEPSRQAAVATRLREGRVDDNAIVGNFLQSAYRTQAQQIIADADTRTTTNTEEDSQKRWDRINLALDIAGIFLPPKITIPLSLIRAAAAFFNINEALQNDHKEDAWQAFLEGLAHLSGAALDGVTQDGTRSSASLGSRFRKSSRDSNAANDAQPASETRMTPPIMSPHASASSSPAAPTGMTSVEIDGQTCFYWQSTKNTVNYRDLFEHDPAHPGQLKSAGYGAPDINQVWKKISLRGGGDTQNTRSQTAGNNTETVLNAEAARLIKKIPSPADGIEYFSANISGQNRRLVYNVEDNTFSAPGARQRKRYFPRYNKMVQLNPQVARNVTDADREATLCALGINLKLPLELPMTAATNTTPIPRVIHSVWVGGEIPAARRDAILSSLENNAVMARSGVNPYEMKLYLSNRNPTAYASNLELLHSRAPSVSVVTLEDTPFYQTFRQSKYFSQYLAAIDGNGGVAINYASAADVLRYRLLQHEGGLYLDCDDTLTAPPGSIDIKTTSNGLALDDPVSNILLGMDMQYNTSIFGTQKNNPTLDAISEESYTRYIQAPGLYISPRPKRLTAAQRRDVSSDINAINERRLYAYMQRISYVTGPNVFNKVIDNQLPDMRQIREAIKLKSHAWNFRLSLPMRINIEAAAETALPLGKINRMGNAHTWDQSR